MIVLDTNVISELMRPVPSPAVVGWVAAQPAASLFTTAVTQAEVMFGVMLLPAERRRRELERAVAGLFAEDFADRVLPFDQIAALEFGIVAAARRLDGRPIAHADAQIAAICRSRGAALATRNVSDFDGCDLRVIDPFA